ncbi:MAG: phage tail sheath family protein, partial [bacterium]|nr:phage tail sheath family protein [bacterium]
GLDLANQTITDLNDTSMNPAVSAPTSSSTDTNTIIFGATTFTATSTLGDVARTLQERIRAIDPADPVYSQSNVEVVNSAIRVVMGGDSPDTTATFSNPAAGDSLATPMRVRNGQTISGQTVNENVRRYGLGLGEFPRKNQTAVGQGRDGLPGGALQLMGNELRKEGIHALDNVDIINILCMPETPALPDSDASTVIAKAAAYAAQRRAFYVIDPPNSSSSTQTEIATWYGALGLQSKNAAIYFPRVRLADPLQNFRIGPFAPSGTMAGLYARTDATRGVWKAPAGTEAGLRVPGLDVQLTDDENGALNKLGVNCLRTFPVYGRVSWGARTTDGADQKASEWKYVPVRRTALMIEESLFRGLQWAVFEPNDEGLYAQIRVAAGGFMHNLFRQHAFQGSSPRDAYFVKCDRETTTQNDIDLGIVNVLVGFAPFKPAEFVILKIQQIAGQVQT